MPRAPLHALRWSSEQGLYEWSTRGQVVHRFHREDEAAWQAWLAGVTSFAFHCPGGSLNVYQERRPHGGQYWYAYHTDRDGIRKRYLGQTAQVTLARLAETAQALSSASPPPTRASSPVQREIEPELPLLLTKLAPPPLSPALVERPHLYSTLDGALSTPLTLLAASAGWGKTTLLAAWARQHQKHVAWLSLDELDNSPTRFWVALIAALRRCPGLASNFGENVVAQLQSPQPPPLSSCLSVLLHELERTPPHPAPIVLLLDDYQVIEESGIHQGMAFFLEHLPAHLHLILSSRVDPDLPLARLRAHGQLVEIRADELRFQEGEASQFLGKMLSPPLSEEELQRLVSRTEGWIAGLHLVALTMQKHEDRTAYLETLTGSQRYLLDYVQEDILAGLSPDTRDFLLHSAVLSRLDASVCQAVTAAPTAAASQQMLALLERANFFLVPLDEERHSYRLHDLFREALLARLHATHPELVPLLHRQAACFYESQGNFHEAIAHAMEAADFSLAARLMEQTVEQFWLRGEAAMMANWAQALPEQTMCVHARLVLTTALYLLNTVAQTTAEQRTRVHRQVRQLLARVENARRREIDETNHQHPATQIAPDATEDALLHRRLHWLRLQLGFLEATANGDLELLQRLQLEIAEALDQDEEAPWQMVPLGWSFVLHHTVWREGAVLLPRLLSAKARMSLSGSHFASLKVRQYLAMAAMEAGKLHLAADESQAAMALIEQSAGYALLKGYFELVLAEVCYQWNQLEEARGLLHAALEDAALWQHLDVLGSAYISLMEVELATGAWSAAKQALEELERLVQREHYADYPGYFLQRRACWWLAQGQLSEASDWAAGVVFPEGVWDRSLYFAYPVVIRVYFAQHRWQEARSLLERWSGHLDRPASMDTIIFLAQSLVALHQTGQDEQAHRVAARLFAMTEPEGYVRLYLDEGEPMKAALQALLTPPSQQSALVPATTAYVSKLLAAFELEQQGASRSQEAAPTPESQPALAPASSELGASLTRREQDVLRLLAEGASNQEIAQTLVISLETVKKHVSHLLGKLGATSRTQAITLARARSLL
ncbi:MAG TPA: LuxR C-terminal-related transcriptional regulator [Ktedonobacterales bacterium]|nr:LuxR C-terminal-related transcriptional regulator [Ktedonobacterales bacterium]